MKRWVDIRSRAEIVNRVGRRSRGQSYSSPAFSHSDLGRPHHQLRRMQEMLQKMKQQMQDQ
jgi:hypothetical protein